MSQRLLMLRDKNIH